MKPFPALENGESGLRKGGRWSKETVFEDLACEEAFSQEDPEFKAMCEKHMIEKFEGQLFQEDILVKNVRKELGAC